MIAFSLLRTALCCLWSFNVLVAYSESGHSGRAIRVSVRDCIVAMFQWLGGGSNRRMGHPEVGWRRDLGVWGVPFPGCEGTFARS